VHTSAPDYNGQGVRGTKSPEADDIFLFKRLLLKKLITDIEKL